MDIVKKFHIGSLDHMTHVDNLDSIFEHGLLAHNNPYKKKDISNTDVNSRRDKIETIHYRKIHDYVPFYFNPRNAMMYKNKNEDIVVLAFSKKIMQRKGTVFTDRNAATGRVRFLSHINQLETVNWDYVWSTTWAGLPNEQEVKEVMMAEVLVQNMVSMKDLMGIFVKNIQMQKYLMDRYNLSSKQILVKPNIFFA